MEIAHGTFTVTNEHGSLTLRTAREGIGARAGHDLTIVVTQWRAVAQRDMGGTTIEGEIDPTSLEVREGSGGVKRLTDKDRADIKKDIERKVLEVERYPRITFTATSQLEWAESEADPTSSRGVLEGDLELHGHRDSLQLDVELSRLNGVLQVSARTSIRQSQWGITPYRGFMGALKVADPVQVDLDVTVSGA